MPSAGQVASAVLPTAASIGTAAAVGTGTLLGLSAGPAGALIGAAAGGLITAVNAIGQGRKTANKMTGTGGPQDIINKQLALISSSPADANEKAQATQKAWTDFLSASKDFAATQGKRAPQVVQQAIYKTPELTNTVSTLLAPLGKTALDPSYTALVPGITATSKVQGSSIPWGSIASTAAGVAAPFAMNALGLGPASTVGQANAGSGPFVGPVDPGGGLTAPTFSGLDTEGNPTSYPAPSETSASYPGDPGTTVGPSPKAGGGILNSIAGPGSGSILSRLLPTLISSGASLIGGALGSSAASDAAQIQAAAATHAADLQFKTGQNALDFQKQVLQQQQQNLQPWLNAGQGALQSIADINAHPFTPPTEEEVMQSPALQFQLAEGQKALESFERAHGTLMSGKAVKDINTFAQGTASQFYDTVFNQNLAARNANLNPLLSVAGLSQTSTGQANQALGNAANLNTNTQLSTAQQVGADQTAAAAASGSGYVGSANSWLGALGNIGNTFTQNATIQQLLASLKQQQQPALT